MTVDKDGKPVYIDLKTGKQTAIFVNSNGE